MWLRDAFADLHYDIHLAAAEGNVVTVNSTMNGRHVAPMVFYTEDGDVDTAFPPTGRTFAITQSHWFHFEDGKIIEHWANRDDLGQAQATRLAASDARLPRPNGVGEAASQTPVGLYSQR